MAYTADKPALPPSRRSCAPASPDGAPISTPPTVPRTRRSARHRVRRALGLSRGGPGAPERERSIEHKFLTPVYGTAQPLKGVRADPAARVRQVQRGSDRALAAADRRRPRGCDRLARRSFASLRPDNPITQTGVLAERRRRPVRSRFGRGRVDMKHAWLDPIIVVGPWIVTAIVAFRLVRGLSRGVLLRKEQR